MTDFAPSTDPGAAGAAPTPAPSPTTPTPSPTAPVTTPDTPTTVDPFGELATDQAVFDRGYVERIRREGAKYRDDGRQAAEKLGRYETVFGGYDEADQQVWLDLAQTWAQDPNKAAKVMQDIASAVLAEQQQPASGSPHVPDAGTDAGEGDDADLGGPSLTPEQVQQMVTAELEKRDAARAEQVAIAEVFAEMKSAGYDPATPEGYMVLWHANNGGNGDIKYGVDKVQAYRQQIVDEYVKGRANGAHPIPSPRDGVVASTSEPVLDLNQARKAADAFLRGQIGASNG